MGNSRPVMRTCHVCKERRPCYLEQKQEDTVIRRGICWACIKRDDEKK